MLTDDVFGVFEYLLYSINRFSPRSLKYSSPLMITAHSPVLLTEVLEALQLTSGTTVIDATLGLGGHARCMLERIESSGRLFGFDWDERNRAIAAENLQEFPQFTIIPASFAHMQTECSKRGIEQVDAVMMDLGISSPHLDDAERGFSYRLDGPLDMRMDSAQPESAADLINFLTEQGLTDIFRKLGEEPFSRPLAQAIIEQRKQAPFSTTSDLYDVIERVCYRNPKKTASRIFQALRIAVNHELDELESALPQAAQLLSSGGRLAIITFHSLEDRIVKNFFRDLERSSKGKTSSWRRINKKVIIPTDEEMTINPRSRSAKLRILERISNS